tara:strand:- start:24043 stop:25002 length:960 start_codon:yes stop_codon:yes gene_type:complete
MNILKSAKDLFVSPTPHVFVEFSKERLTVVVFERNVRGLAIKEFREKPLGEGILNASFLSRNVQDAKGLRSILQDAYGTVKRRHNRIGIALPDSIVKISLVDLDTVPKSRKDLDSVIRWSIEKSIPFNLDEAQVSYALQKINENQRQRFIVLTSRREVVLEYERLCESIGLQAGLIVPSSIAVSKLLHTFSAHAKSGDCLFVNSTIESGSIVILRDENIVYFKTLSSVRTEDLATLVHQTNMYYEDRLNGKGFDRIFYLGGENDREELELQKSILFPLVSLSKIIVVTENEIFQKVPFSKKALCAASAGMAYGLNNYQA